ncbi:serine threonine protein kinase [Aspergillus sclerotialis]|uniref:Serine threonine protein kinase n=1 Tax=Aspergillus sclerotialis TaxID=2070753 RepID=A0A3A2ZS06_9EURO|nr:serine threonine protein kinase [Aspergillus sclerotialis]
MAERLQKLPEPISKFLGYFTSESRHSILDGSGFEQPLASQSSTNSTTKLQVSGSIIPPKNTLGDRTPGKYRPSLKNGKHCHFQRSPRKTIPFLGNQCPKKLWMYIRRYLPICRRACLRPSVDLEEEVGIQRTSAIEITECENGTADFQIYGRVCGVIGHGSSGLILKIQEWYPTADCFYAIKVFRPGTLTNEEKGYGSRIRAEFSITSSLRHQNVVRTFDLLQTDNDRLCECLEYCSGGDLHSLIVAKRQLGEAESDCFFKQLMRGINYIHEMGVAHRDLKPENLLLTSRGCLKISDFGTAECFRLAWENGIHMSRQRRGSRPYISPEQYLNKEFDPRSVDIWAAAVTYVAMRTGRIPWNMATTDDECFRDYLADLKVGRGYFLIEDICHVDSRRVIYSMLDIDYMGRPRSNEVLRSQWLQEIETCTDADTAAGYTRFDADWRRSSGLTHVAAHEPIR